LSLGGPELQLGVARRAQFHEVFLAAIEQFHPGHHLRVAAIERLREAQDGRQRAHGVPLLRAESAERGVRPRRRRLAMIARDRRDDFRLLRLETPEIAVLDQIVRVFVMPGVTDVRADIVEQRGEVEPLPLAIGQPMDAARLIEDRQREPRDLVRVLGPVTAALGQLDDAAAPHVRVLPRLGDVLPVALDVIEHQPLAQREVAQGDLGGVEMPQHGVEQDRAGDDEIGAPRIEPRHLHALRDAAGGDVFSQPADLLGRDAEISDFVARAPPIGQRDRSEAQDCSGRANHAIEAGGPDLAKILRELVIDVVDELSLIASRQRVGPHESLGQANDP